MSNERGNCDGSSRKGVPWSVGNHTVDVRPKNWLTPVALLTLREKSSYGYELMNRIAKFGFETINPGTLYRSLRHMEKEGLCESEWETSNGAGCTRSRTLGKRISPPGPRSARSTNGFLTLST
jgi:Transcriptional regulator PadR-like family